MRCKVIDFKPGTAGFRTYDFQRVNLPIDATETLANPWALAVVARKGLPTKYHPELENIALEFAAAAIL